MFVSIIFNLLSAENQFFPHLKYSFSRPAYRPFESAARGGRTTRTLESGWDKIARYFSEALRCAFDVAGCGLSERSLHVFWFHHWELRCVQSGDNWRRLYGGECTYMVVSAPMWWWVHLYGVKCTYMVVSAPLTFSIWSPSGAETSYGCT
jgi:hypothetical protein